MGEKSFVSTSPWPEHDERLTSVEAEEIENLVKNVLEDTQNILNATKMTPKKIYYYTAAPWKWKVYSKTLESSSDKSVTMTGLMRGLMEDKELKPKAKQVSKFVMQLIEEINRMPNEKKQRQLQISTMNEMEALTESIKFFAEEFNAEIHVNSEEDMERYDPKKRAELAKPYRPAIFIE